MSYKQMTFRKGMTLRQRIRELKWIFKTKPPTQHVKVMPVTEGEKGSMSNG